MRGILGLFCMLFAFSSFAQNGTIRGKVIEDESGLELIGATVQVEGIEGGTITDIDGAFSLNVPAGTHTVIFSYVSYETQRVEGVEVTAKDVTVMGEVRMAEESVEIEAVVVTAKAIQNSENAMQTLQRKGINTIDAISSQAFSLRGDGDAAAAMKRVTGISVEGGKYVYVRGLGDRYSKTTLNGSNIPGLDPDKNTVQMDLFPTNLIDNIIVYKNFTPNLPGDFTGGLVNISTKDFPEDFTMQTSLSFGYNANANFNGNFLTYEGSDTDWLGFDNGVRDFPAALDNVPLRADAIGAIGNQDYSLSQQITEATLSLNNILEPSNQAPVMNHGISVALGDQYSLGGKPVGFIASLTYNRDFSGFGDGTTGRYKLTQFDADALNPERLLVDNRYTDAVLLGGMVNGSIKLNNLNKISINLLRNQTGETMTRFQEGVVLGSAINGPYQERTLSYIERSITSGQLRGNHAIGDPEGKILKIDWSTSYTFSDMSQPDLRFVNNFIDTIQGVATPIIDRAEDIPPTRFNRSMNETNWDNHLDFSWEFVKGSNLKFGGAYLTKQREFRDRVFRYENENAGNVGDGNYSNYLTEENVWVWNEETINDVGVFIQDFSEDRNQYDSQMDIFAGYAMAEMSITKRSKAIFGARAEQTNLYFTSFDEGKGLDNTQLLDNLDILPSAALIFEAIPDKMNVRASYSRTLARPTFREVAPICLFDVVNNAIICGNENLQRTLIDNMDFRWEYFFKPGEMISASVFYKDFTNPIELTLSPEAPNSEFIYRNVERGIAYGAEFEIRKSLDFIEALNGFSIGGNFTYVVSEVDIPETELLTIRALDPTAEATRPMFAQSPYIVNGFLQYVNAESGTRASISYNVQGPRLTLVSRGGTPNVFEQPFSALDFKISQRIGNNLNASFGVRNILNSELRITQEYKDEEYIFQSRVPGVNFSLGLSYNISNN
jgi:outer membrane receptor for ferrienterochelin and colicin